MMVSAQRPRPMLPAAGPCICLPLTPHALLQAWWVAPKGELSGLQVAAQARAQGEAGGRGGRGVRGGPAPGQRPARRRGVGRQDRRRGRRVRALPHLQPVAARELPQQPPGHVRAPRYNTRDILLIRTGCGCRMFAKAAVRAAPPIKRLFGACPAHRCLNTEARSAGGQLFTPV